MSAAILATIASGIKSCHGKAVCPARSSAPALMASKIASGGNNPKTITKARADASNCVLASLGRHLIRCACSAPQVRHHTIADPSTRNPVDNQRSAEATAMSASQRLANSGQPAATTTSKHEAQVAEFRSRAVTATSTRTPAHKVQPPQPLP